MKTTPFVTKAFLSDHEKAPHFKGTSIDGRYVSLWIQADEEGNIVSITGNITEKDGFYD